MRVGESEDITRLFESRLNTFFRHKKEMRNQTYLLDYLWELFVSLELKLFFFSNVDIGIYLK